MLYFKYLLHSGRRSKRQLAVKPACLWQARSFPLFYAIPLLTEWPLDDKESDHNVDADDTDDDGIDEDDGLKL